MGLPTTERSPSLVLPLGYTIKITGAAWYKAHAPLEDRKYEWNDKQFPTENFQQVG